MVASSLLLVLSLSPVEQALEAKAYQAAWKALPIPKGKAGAKARAKWLQEAPAPPAATSPGPLHRPFPWELVRLSMPPDMLSLRAPARQEKD